MCVLTNIEGDVSVINNLEPKALVKELPLCENKHKQLHVSSALLLTLHMKMSTDVTMRVGTNEMRQRKEEGTFSMTAESNYLLQPPHGPSLCRLACG